LESLVLLIAALVFFTGTLFILFKFEMKLSRSYEQVLANLKNVPPVKTKTKKELAEGSSNLTINFITINMDEKDDDEINYSRRLFPEKGADGFF